MDNPINKYLHILEVRISEEYLTEGRYREGVEDLVDVEDEKEGGADPEKIKKNTSRPGSWHRSLSLRNFYDHVSPSNPMLAVIGHGSGSVLIYCLLMNSHF